MTYIVLLLALLGQADIMSLASVSVCLLIYNVIIEACLSSKGFFCVWNHQLAFIDDVGSQHYKYTLWLATGTAVLL